VLTLRSPRLLDSAKQFLVADRFSEDIGFHGIKTGIRVASGTPIWSGFAGGSPEGGSSFSIGFL
jgi:hypothetical protein